MVSFTVYPTSTMLLCARGNRHKGHVTEGKANFTICILAMLSLVLALTYQQGELHSNYGTRQSLFLGTAHVSAAVASTALSTSVARSDRTGMVTMAAGSSRTLIELTNHENDKSVGEVQFELTFLDEDDENGLLVLRRANANSDHQRKSVMEGGGCTVCKKAARALKNPVVFLVLAGNIASMTGILPPGIAGFLPAVGIFLRNNMKWTAPILGKLGSLRLGKGILFKFKGNKLIKAVSNLYKNRSKYSLLGDCLWHVDFDEKKTTADDGARPSTDKALA